jgi:hypothetical protein
MRRSILIVVVTCGVACRKSLIFRNALAVLIPVALPALLAVTLLIIVAIYPRAPVFRQLIVTLVMLHPLSHIASILPQHWMGLS